MSIHIRNFILILFLTLITVIPKQTSAGVKITEDQKGRLFVLSIGIDKYPYMQLDYCVSDSRSITEKVIRDYLVSILEISANDSSQLLLRRNSDSVNSFVLNNGEASFLAIKKAFETISLTARPNDFFVFYFSGLTAEIGSTKQTFLVPFITGIQEIRTMQDSLFASNSYISIKLLSKWMDLVQCKNQLIISEAGNGDEFSTNLAINLFETNTILQANSSRNRVIITTNELGVEGKPCEGTQPGGPLTNFLCHSSNILSVFDEPAKYEFEILQKDVACNVNQRGHIYSRFLFEKNFCALQQKLVSGNPMRGSELIDDENETGKAKATQNKPKNYAILIATNNYNNTDWPNLKNPVNDATAIADLLKKQFSYETNTVINQNRDTIYAAIKKYKSILRVEDNLMVFIAGHGYYDKNFSDGNIVTNDSKSVGEDPNLDTYIPLAKLNRLIDNMPSKHVFLVLDICFGGSFDLLSPDLAIEKYNSDKADISIDTLIARKKDNYSRIFLASGSGTVPDYWSNSLNHSPFAQKMIDAMNGNESFLTPGILYSSLERNITEPKFKSFGRHEPRGDYFFVRLKP